MFSLFPVHRPKIGISVHTRALDLVEVRRRWRQPSLLRRLASQPLPPGLLTPSFTALNITDQEVFKKELQALLIGMRDRTVAIDLPLPSAALGLFMFDTFPTAPAEQDALLRWRFRQEEHVTTNDLHLASRVFGAGKLNGGSQAVSVLAVAVRECVLRQYHQAFESAGLLPVSVGFSTLNLFDFYWPSMPQSRECFFAHRTAEALRLIAIDDGRPVLLRVKPAGRSPIDLKAELIKTLQFFDSRFPHAPVTEGSCSSPLFIVDELDGSRQTGEQTNVLSPEVWTPTGNPHWTITVTYVNWLTVPKAKGIATPLYPPFGALAGALTA